MKNVILFLSLFLTISTQPVFACLSCSCQSSGASADLGVLGGASGIFSKGKQFIFQFGTNLVSTNGTFNELGTWNQPPLESGIYTMQNIMSLMYFPSKDFSFGFQLPLVSNLLSKATWGSFGSISPTDSDKSLIGVSLGDLTLQGTYKFYEDSDNFASSVWVRLDLPTGQSNVKSEYLSGSGVTKITGGIFAVKKFSKFEILGNIGYQTPLGKLSYNSFSVGNAFMYQIHGNYQLLSDFKLGVGLLGLLGEWLYSNNNNSIGTGKIKLLATTQYDFSMYNGISLAFGYDPRLFGTNTTTDMSLSAVFYQYF